MFRFGWRSASKSDVARAWFRCAAIVCFIGIGFGANFARPYGPSDLSKNAPNSFIGKEHEAGPPGSAENVCVFDPPPYDDLRFAFFERSSLEFIQLANHTSVVLGTGPDIAFGPIKFVSPWVKRDCCVRSEHRAPDGMDHVMGGCLSAVFQNDCDVQLSVRINFAIPPIRQNVSARLDLPYMSRNRNGVFRCHGGFGGFIESALRVNQGAPNQENATGSKDYAPKGGEEHPHGPMRHLLLGLKIVCLAAAFLIGLVLGVCGFKRAGDATDVILAGNKRGWLPLAGCMVYGFGGVGLMAGSITILVAGLR